MKLIEHATAEQMDQAVAARLENACKRAVAANGRARLALAGGSTPMPIYRELARRPLDWGRIALLPGDERWVAHDQPACNLTAIRDAFAPRPADFRALTPERPGDAPNLTVARASWAALDQGLDACLLGMGGDGHFASLFPGAPELAAGLAPDQPEPFLIVHPDPLPAEAPFARVSLTLAAILHAPELLLAIRGADKRAVLERAAAEGADSEMPISALLAATGDALEIHWSA